MRRLSLRGVIRGKSVSTSESAKARPCPLDRVNRQFHAARHAARAETIKGLYKAEMIHRRSWRNREQMELPRLDWAHGYKHTRLLASIRHVPPAQAGAAS